MKTFADTKWGDMTGGSTTAYISVMNQHLTSLKGSPKKAGVFHVNDNDLTDLVGAPKEVEAFNCSNNKLTSLKGAPEHVDTYFECSNNPNLKNLKGAPKVIGGTAIFENCGLTSLEGLGEVHSILYLDGNNFESKDDIFDQIIKYKIQLKDSFVWKKVSYDITYEFRQRQKLGKFKDFLDL